MRDSLDDDEDAEPLTDRDIECGRDAGKPEAMASADVRELNENLRRYLRRVEAGERIAVTDHGRLVAELGPPSSARHGRGMSRYDELVAAGIIRPPLEDGDPVEGWPALRLSTGTASALIDADRDEQASPARRPAR